MTTIEPTPDTRLHQLAAAYDAAKATADEATERLNEIKDGIKAELVAAAPGEKSVLLKSADLHTPLRLSASVQWRLDSKSLRADLPETYVKYAKQTTIWSLRVAS